MKLLVDILLFVALTAERDDTFVFGRWHTLMAYARPLLEAKLPLLGLGAWDIGLLAAAAVVMLQARTWKQRVRPFDLILATSLLALLAWVGYGLLRGGDLRQALTQTNALVRMYILYFVVHALVRTRRDLGHFALVVVAAALWRAAACLWFYTFYVRNGGIEPFPEVITDHHDSVLWVVTLLGLCAFALSRPRLKLIMPAGLAAALLLVAVKLNDRRIAWVELAGGIGLMYLALPAGRLRRTINRGLIASAPLLVLYLAVGWSSSSPVFLPVQQLKSISETSDPSNDARAIENRGLVVTLQQQPVLGTGLGHMFVEVSDTYSLGMSRRFPNYRYLPHDSLVGLLAFTGAAGFSLIWLFVPAGQFLAIRAAHHARHPQEAAFALLGFAFPFVYSAHAFGDMGIQSLQANVLLAMALAYSARLATRTGGFAGRSPRASSTPTPQGELP